MARRRKLSDQIRDAVDASGMSRYELCKRIGLNQSSMSRFMSRELDLRLETIDRIADVLGIGLVVRPPRPAKRRKTKGR